jgi:CheY-like chemotaxis protein
MSQAFGCALVLLVDPDADTREMYRRAFEIAGYRAIEASGVAALADISDVDPPDVVLTEWRLADGDGPDVARRIRSRAALRNTTLIAVTGTVLDPGQEKAAVANGFERVLLKPALPERVVEIVQEIVRLNAERRLRAAAQQTARCAALVSPWRLARGEEHAGLFEKAASIIDRAAARVCGPVALVLADDDGRYVAASDGAVDLTGYARDALLKRSLWDLTPTADLEAGLRQWADLIATGAQQGTCVMQRADGSSLRVQYYAIANVAPGLHVSAISQAPGSIMHPSAA